MVHWYNKKIYKGVLVKNFIFAMVMFFSTNIYAGWFSFAADAASISGALSSSPKRSTVINTDLNKVNTYLWKMVESNNYVDGYEFLAEALEESNNLNGLDTAAQAYFANGKKEKALEIY